MALDTEHEPIESPEALFRHLDEAHHVAEARDLDPETAPVQFWLRRHAELEHGMSPPPEHVSAGAARRAAAPPRTPQAPPRTPQESQRTPHAQPRTPQARGAQSPAPGTRDPLVAAVVAALVRRGHDERAVRRYIHACAGPGGTPVGEDGLRARFLHPMLDAIAEELTGAGELTGARPAAPQPPPDAPRPPSHAAPQPPDARAAAPARAIDAAATFEDDVMALADAVQRARVHDPRPARRAGRLDDDAMALADAVQRPAAEGAGARGRRRAQARYP